MNKNNLPTLEQLQKDLKGKTPEEIIELFGKPDKATHLYGKQIRFRYEKEIIYEHYSEKEQGIIIIFDKDKKVMSVDDYDTVNLII